MEQQNTITAENNSQQEHQKEECDKKVAELSKKNEDLKNVLLKSKKYIEQLKADILNLQDENLRLKTSKQEAEKLLEKYFQEDAAHQDQVVVIENVLARIEVEAVPWKWIRELQIAEQLKQQTQQPLPNLVVYRSSLNDELDTEKQKCEQYKKDIDNIIQQYEERMKRITMEQQQSEEKIRQFKQKIERMRTQIGAACKEMVAESQEIRESCLLYLADENDDSTKKENLSKIKVLLVQLKEVKFEFEQEALTDLKDQLLLLHETLFDTLKRLHTQKIENGQLERKWKHFCSEMDTKRKAEEAKLAEIIQNLQMRHIEDERQIELLNGERILALKERDVKIEFLNKELKKNVNIQYIKNILIKFFVSDDQKFKEKTLPVIGTVLQFSESELENVRNACFEKSGVNNTLGRLFGFGGRKD